MSVSKYIDKIWQNMARKQLENELNFLTTDDDKKIKLPIDDNIDYLKMYSDTHKTPEEELKERIDEAIEYIEKHKELLHHSFDEPDCDYWIATNPDDLLNILKGEDNENR